MERVRVLENAAGQMEKGGRGVGQTQENGQRLQSKVLTHIGAAVFCV